MRPLICLTIAAAVASAAAPALAAPKGISDAERAAAALQISNIMGRYAIYVVANKWALIADEFALDEPDVRQNVPGPGQSGPAVREYFMKRDKAALPEGVMHQHAFLSPIIEVAGDGKTAKGVWDSPGIDVGNGNGMANWAWARYAVDFKKEPGGWKIWHMHVASLWRAPYGEAWSQMVQKDSGGAMTGGAPGAAPVRTEGPPPGEGAGVRPAPAMAAGQPAWRYSGKGVPPMFPLPPKPYYSFDPKDAY